MTSTSNVLVTGLPRSGTTLVSALLDGLADAVSLSEPDRHVDVMAESGSPREFVESLERHMASLRKTLIDGGSVADRRAPNGQATTNYFSSPGAGRREPSYVVAERNRSGLSNDFLLAVKHNALYTAVLPELSTSSQWRIVCIIRDPADAICSWRSLDLPISGGRLPAGERYWAQLRDLCNSQMDLLEKQIRICELFFDRYARLSDAVTVLSYEEIVAHPLSLLSAVGRPNDPAPAFSRAVTTAELRGEERERIAHAVRSLARRNAVPAIQRFYPQYL